jgi:hypothetical protein
MRQYLSQNKFQLGKLKDGWLYFSVKFVENAVNCDTYMDIVKKRF